MGHQTSYSQCKKCKGVTIKTKAFGKVIISTSCKCDQVSKQVKNKK